MIEFNADGSLKLTGSMQQAKDEKEKKMTEQMCVLFRKEVISEKSPKKCSLTLKLSKKFTNNDFVDNLYKYFKENSEVPSKITKINDYEFNIEIGTCFRRCSDCNALINRFKDFLDDNVIVEQGSCTYERRENTNFCYEDYFD